MTNIDRKVDQERRLQESLALFGGSSALLQKVLDTIPQSVFWKDRDSVYLGCNYRFAQFSSGKLTASPMTSPPNERIPWLHI